MQHQLLICGVLIAVAGGHFDVRAADVRPLVFQVRLDDEAITPGTLRFLQRVMREADQRRAECLVIMLDTPGGLVDSTSTLVKQILESRTCIVVYVAPSGARAASAGVFLTLASHVAAMAPATRIGAAHPVAIGGLPTMPPRTEPTDQKGEQGDAEPAEASSSLEAKIVNDTVAWARSLAQLRGRNAEWAADAVRKSITATETEALDQGVVDLLAEDTGDLLRQLDGREVALSDGPHRLRTAGAEVRTLEMWWGEQFLAVISTPNFAFLLLIIGFYGIVFELYSPGWGVAGTLGIVCLLLAFFGLAMLPIDYLGLALVAVALGLFVAEIFVTSFGALTAAGVFCLVTGALMLVDSPIGFLRVSLGVVVPIAAAAVLITVLLAVGVIRARRSPVRTGAEAILGSDAVARDDFTAVGDHFSGTVLAHGELWRAQSAAPVRAGQQLRIDGRTGLTLSVREADADPARAES